MNKGFYVDIGCYHPTKGSLTNYLYTYQKWNGLNVDLSRISIDLFKLSRPRDLNINAAITNFDGETHYFENGIINQQNSLDNKNKNKVKIKAYTLNSLLENFKIEQIDYLNIDAEGHDYTIITKFNFSKFKPKVISIEHNSYDVEDLLNSKTHDLIISNRYFLASKFGVTCIYVDTKFKNEIDTLMSV